MNVRPFTRAAHNRLFPRYAALLVLLTSGWAARPDFATAQEIAHPAVDELEDRVVQIFRRSCALAGCHAEPFPQQDMRLTPDAFYASLVGEPSVGRPDLLRVAPGNPDSSYLVMKLLGAPEIEGERMPLAADPLPEEEINAIRAWISELTEVDEERRRPPPREVFPFYGWKVINIPTTRTVNAGSWLFLISHRFNPKVTDGYDTFFGLDGSGIILLSMGYAVTDRLLLSLGRSNAAADVEFQVRYQIMPQGPAAWPIGIGATGTVNWITQRPVEGSRLRPEAFKYTGQVSFTRAWNDRVGTAVVPSILINPDENVDGEPALFAVGLGGRWRFYRNVSLVAEWTPVLSGFARSRIFGNDIRFDSWGGGVEIATSGHVFQILVSNSVGLATDQYLRGGDLDVSEGEMRLGFNIFRILNF